MFIAFGHTRMSYAPFGSIRTMTSESITHHFYRTFMTFLQYITGPMYFIILCISIFEWVLGCSVICVCIHAKVERGSMCSFTFMRLFRICVPLFYVYYAPKFVNANAPFIQMEHPEPGNAFAVRSTQNNMAAFGLRHK